jgi:hypothetical protein
MKKQVIEEIRDMKYLFNYERGRILSEQRHLQDNIDEIEEELDMADYGDEVSSFDEEGNFMGMTTPSVDMEIDEEMNVPVVIPGTKEKERTKTDKPKTPYSPKPGPKKNPKAENRDGDIPNWLSFDELGIDFE